MDAFLILQNDKFLSIAVQTGKINSETRKIALQRKRQRKLNQENIRVGEILIRDGLLTADERDEILAEQKRRRSVRLYRLRRFSPVAPSLVGQKLLVVIFAAMGVVIAKRLGVPLDPATGIAAFFVLVAITALEYRAIHSATLSFIRSLIVCCGFLVVGAFVYSVFTLARLDEIAVLHNTPDSKVIVDAWLFRVKGSFLALAGAAAVLAGYSAWKFHSLRYTQARLGLMKDIIIRVEETLRDQTKTIKGRQAKAIGVVLKGLRNAIRLSLPDRTLRRFTFFFPGRDQITVLYFTPEPTERRFRLDRFAYPEGAPEKVREGFRWMQENHFPRFLDETRFNEMIQLAKGIDSHGWRQRYLNFHHRHEFISIRGWIYATKETLISRDASQCLAYDGRFFEGMKEGQGLTKGELSWITFGSFIGSPVLDSNGEVASVLIVAKSRNNMLEPEDLEISVLASQLIGRILSVKEEANGG
jgi:hypothetical protein